MRCMCYIPSKKEFCDNPPIGDGFYCDNHIDDAIDLWHDGKGEGVELHIYLGMSYGNYKLWVEGKLDDKTSLDG